MIYLLVHIDYVNWSNVYVALNVDNTFNGLVIECVDSMARPLNVHIQ